MNPPKISIVIPSYNQGAFIEETLRSALDQNYPALELIVIDGGSTDTTLEVLNRYKERLTYLVSEPDRGQTHAINKGLEKVTGELWSYLNSDDLLLPGSLMKVATIYEKTGSPWIAGISEKFDERGSHGYIDPVKPDSRAEYLALWNRDGKYFFPCSNVCFMARTVIEKIGVFDESLHYSMDIEYYVKAIFEGSYEPYCIHEVLGRWRIHSESKTMNKGSAYGFRQDEATIAKRYKKYLDKDAQRILQHEIDLILRGLVLQKLSFEYDQKKQQIPLYQLVASVLQHPGLLSFRPWYGEVRRRLFN